MSLIVMHAQPPKNPEKSAFTLTELLVVIATVAILTTLRLFALAPTEEKAHRLGCLNNLKQLALGSMMYASDYHGHYSSYTWFEPGFTPTAATDRSGSDDDLSWLYPRYVKSLSSFVCPSTQNYIRTNLATKPTGGDVIRDLSGNAASPKSAGTSYEVFGTFGVRTAVGSASTSTKKKEDTVNAFTDWYYPPALGMKPGPSRIFLITDADDTSLLVPNDINNWPDSPTDNHGAAGQNFSFCDGHAQWVKQSKFREVWNIGQDSNRTAGVN
jgi:prepilin-type processing-associated H-X9-DG protein